MKGKANVLNQRWLTGGLRALPPTFLITSAAPSTASRQLATSVLNDRNINKVSVSREKFDLSLAPNQKHSTQSRCNFNISLGNRESESVKVILP